jgi:dUTP pyrophosphatase
MQFKLLHENAKVPTKAHSTDSGYDFYALEDVAILPEGVTKVKTGVALSLPEKVWMKIEAKSGLATRQNLGVTAGIIDNEYRGEIVIAMVNYGREFQTLKRGQKVAQGVLMPLVETEKDEVVTEFSDETDRGEKGFGSSGKF